MDPRDPKQCLWRYLDVAHDAVLWKLDGLSEYDLRRPLTPTGTNLLGIVKHLAWVELGYLGDVFDRPHGVDLPANSDEVNADMYATIDETSDDIIELFATARATAKATFDALDLDATGHVPWWGDANPVTLHWIAVHLATEINRHLGQMDILREGLDRSVGHRADNDNLPPLSAEEWSAHHDRLQAIAEQAAGRRSDG
jgi:hypothetical protein